MNNSRSIIENNYNVIDRKSGKVKWSATSVDLVFGLIYFKVLFGCWMIIKKICS